jgi:hypothetical protein
MGGRRISWICVEWMGCWGKEVSGENERAVGYTELERLALCVYNWLWTLFSFGCHVYSIEVKTCSSWRSGRGIANVGIIEARNNESNFFLEQTCP